MPFVNLKIPLKLVTPNKMEHWTERHKRNKKQRQVINYFLNTQEKPPFFPLEISLTRIGPREWDYDNLVFSFKNSRDTLSDWLIPGKAKGQADGDKRLQWLYSQEKGEPKEHAILIVITATDKII